MLFRGLDVYLPRTSPTPNTDKTRTEADSPDHGKLVFSMVEMYLEQQIAVPRLKTRLAELATRKASVEERLAAAWRTAGLQQAQEAHQEAIKRFCAIAAPLRGFAKLTPEGRQRLLRALVDEIVLSGTEIEIRGVLPGRWLPPGDRYRSHAADSVISYEPKGYLLVLQAPSR
jgi:hypothetical protein